MTESEWQSCADPEPMLEFLRSVRGESRRKGGRRKLRLFACACLRGIWPLLRKTGSRRAVLVAEQFADGLADNQELAMASRLARAARASEYPERGQSPYWQSSEAAVRVAARQFGGDHASIANAALSAATAWAMSRAGPGQSRQVSRERQARQAAHADWLRDIFSNPFGTVPRIAPAWLAWNGGTVKKLAQAIYEGRSLSGGALDNGRLAVLADALEEAGCDSEEILLHCRQQGSVHVRGCWVLDLILGKS
jgi:hypothetical protein